jgi:hypothetical protein
MMDLRRRTMSRQAKATCVGSDIALVGSIYSTAACVFALIFVEAGDPNEVTKTLTKSAQPPQFQRLKQ